MLRSVLCSILGHHFQLVWSTRDALALHIYQYPSTFDSICLHNWLPSFDFGNLYSNCTLSTAKSYNWWRSSMELAYNSLVPVAGYNTEGTHRLDIGVRAGFDYPVILCPCFIRVVPTIHLQKQFPCKCIWVTVPCIDVRMVQRYCWVALVEDINSAVWARPRHVDRPVRILINDKEYAGVTISPKISWNYLHIHPQGHLRRKNSLPKKVWRSTVRAARIEASRTYKINEGLIVVWDGGWLTIVASMDYHTRRRLGFNFKALKVAIDIKESSFSNRPLQ